MKTKQVTVREGEWLGDAPDDWDYEAFYAKYLGQNRDYFERAVRLYKEMAAALKRGATVYATTSGDFTHKVFSCGLYDGWVFWCARPCFLRDGPLGPQEEEFYGLRAIRIEESALAS